MPLLGERADGDHPLSFREVSMRTVVALVAVVSISLLAPAALGQTKPAPAPAAAKPAGGGCKLAISGSDAMQYDKKELKVPATCKTVELTLTHSGKLAAGVMGHNWVLAKTADVAALTSAGLKAGIKNNHVPPGDKRVLASTKVVGGGQSTTVSFSTAGMKAGEAYTYFCTFPGHAAIMKGKFVFG
jgi:azurin